MYMLFKTIFLTVFAGILLLSPAAAAPESVLSPEKDFHLGPFQCGDVYSADLAEKHLGEITEIQPFSLRKIPGTGRYGFHCGDGKEMQEERHSEYHGRYIIFSDTVLTVINNRIAGIKTCKTELPTARCLYVGDEMSRVINLYGAPAEYTNIGRADQETIPLRFTGNRNGVKEWFQININRGNRVDSIEMGTTVGIPDRPER